MRFDGILTTRNDERGFGFLFHALALAGGWPGALLAQQWLRHKSTKQSFRQRFWLTVAVNIIGFALLCSPPVRTLWSAW